MRLWHKDLIDVLPRQQLLAQWRELCSIYSKEDRHILINFIYDYPPNHFYTYSLLVIDEMRKRGYKLSESSYKRFTDYFQNKKCKKINIHHLFTNKMNDRYLQQCYFNLQEKYDCNAIKESEWALIENKLKERITVTEK